MRLESFPTEAAMTTRKTRLENDGITIHFSGDIGGSTIAIWSYAAAGAPAVSSANVGNNWVIALND